MKNLKQLTVVMVAILGLSQVANANLTHRYSFNTDGSANDSVGGANGTLMGTTSVSGGQLNLPGGAAATDNYLNLPAATIAINTYIGLTLEMWHTQPAIDQGFSMTAAFGGTWGNGTGQNYLMIATTRDDNAFAPLDASRGAIANTPDQDAPWADELGVNGPELNDATEHHYALTVSATELIYYIDGVQIGTPQALGVQSLANISTTFAYLGKGMYSADGLVQGSINEYRIWNEVLSGSQISASFLAGANTVVPEPSTLALIGLALAGMAMRRRRS